MKKLLLIFCVFTVFACCKKKGDCEDPGTGGSVTIICFPQHHGDAIPGSKIYLKFDAEEFPGDNTAVYDVSYTAANGSADFITATGLKCGQYYIYSTGYDSTIFDNVKGGIPYYIDQKEGTVNIIVPVTED